MKIFCLLRKLEKAADTAILFHQKVVQKASQYPNGDLIIIACMRVLPIPHISSHLSVSVICFTLRTNDETKQIKAADLQNIIENH